MTSQQRISHRIGSIAESATLAVDAKAKALKAAGRPVIGFGAGEPDFPTPDYIVEAAIAACRDPKWHRYTPAGGLPELKEAIAVKTLRDSGYEITASQVLVTNGGKHAVFTAFAALCDPGDEVICPAPYWTTYPEAITLAGGVPVIVQTDETTGFKVTIEQLDAALTPRTKVLLFVSPDNPSGAIYSPEEVEACDDRSHRRDLEAGALDDGALREEEIGDLPDADPGARADVVGRAGLALDPKTLPRRPGRDPNHVSLSQAEIELQDRIKADRDRVAPASNPAPSTPSTPPSPPPIFSATSRPASTTAESSTAPSNPTTSPTKKSASRSSKPVSTPPKPSSTASRSRPCRRPHPCH